LIRVPKNRPNKPQAARIELRCPDPTCNPYLAFAVMLRSGLEGIENDIEVPEPVEENLYHFDESELRRRNIQTLPGSLHEALQEMEKDELVRETLGDHITDRLLEAKYEEWNEFRMRVTVGAGALPRNLLGRHSAHYARAAPGPLLLHLPV